MVLPELNSYNPILGSDLNNTHKIISHLLHPDRILQESMESKELTSRIPRVDNGLGIYIPKKQSGLYFQTEPKQERYMSMSSDLKDLKRKLGIRETQINTPLKRSSETQDSKRDLRELKIKLGIPSSRIERDLTDVLERIQRRSRGSTQVRPDYLGAIIQAEAPRSTRVSPNYIEELIEEEVQEPEQDPSEPLEFLAKKSKRKENPLASLLTMHRSNKRPRKGDLVEITSFKDDDGNYKKTLTLDLKFYGNNDTYYSAEVSNIRTTTYDIMCSVKITKYTINNSLFRRALSAIWETKTKYKEKWSVNVSDLLVLQQGEVFSEGKHGNAQLILDRVKKHDSELDYELMYTMLEPFDKVFE